MTAQDHMDERLEREINDILGKQKQMPSPKPGTGGKKRRRPAKRRQDTWATEIALALSLLMFVLFLVRLGPLAAVRLIPVLALVALAAYVVVRFGRGLWR